MSGFERDPKKRRVKPVGPAQQSLLDFDLGESSDDSDFRIEDHCEESDDDSDSENSGKGKLDASSSSSEDSDASEEESRKAPAHLTVEDLIAQARQRSRADVVAASRLLICCGCLGDRSDDLNEIVECDSCGVTVHEGCYGVADNASISSDGSMLHTEAWFCEACKAGIPSPTCELCPNSGGIFKETDVGKWVHLVCALYVPGVAFGEVDRLSSVTLFEMPYSKWGGKSCALCEDEGLARTGVCIGCDAGMCRTHFHVTCAQREGLLSEAHSEEVDQADPFYAHCKMHSDKMLIRKRRRNWLALQLQTEQRRQAHQQATLEGSTEQQRITHKLGKHRKKHLEHRATRIPPWVPTQKMPRLLTTSASACRKLRLKAELMGIDVTALEMQEAQVASLVDVRKKWHIQPAFSVEFIGYFLDRNDRLSSMKRKLQELLDVNSSLQEEQQGLILKYDQLLAEKSELSQVSMSLKQTVHKYHSVILHAVPTKELPSIDELVRPRVAQSPRPGRLPSHRTECGPMSLNECGTCHQTREQHLLAKCDTCHLFYHLGCLNPPLTRMPKKTKLMGWQCSECDKETSGSEVECPDPEAPRRLRHAKEGEKQSSEPVRIKVRSPSPRSRRVSERQFVHPIRRLQTPVEPEQPPPPAMARTFAVSMPSGPQGTMTISSTYSVLPAIPTKQAKKRRREKHHRYSPDGPIRERKRKHKRKSLDLEPQQNTPRIKIKIKPIPMPAGEMSGGPQMFVATSSTETMPLVTPSPSKPAPRARTSSGGVKRGKEVDVMTQCDVCNGAGSNENLVRCDECKRCFHFTCLDPPVKKSPKRRGYSWHCTDCDPTETESDGN